MMTMTAQELAVWMNEAAGYMAALASYPEETDSAEMRESNALYKASVALEVAATHLTQLRRKGVQQEIIVINTQGGAK